MARSPTDATRFTATGPYASSSTSFSPNPNPSPSQQGPRGSQISFDNASANPLNESAQQKIARLRAAAAVSRAASSQETSFERTVRIGRLWADRAHRFTALGLIGLTVISGMVAAAGITDMLIHNRRRRNEWMAEQGAKRAMELGIARQAQDQGRETEEQRLLINQARAAMEAEQERQNRPGMFRRATSWVTGGLAKEEQKGGRLGAEAREKAAAAERAGKEEILGEREDRGVLQAVEEKIEAHRRAGERVEETTRPLGGPLDGQAQQVSDAVVSSSRSWTSWITGR